MHPLSEKSSKKPDSGCIELFGEDTAALLRQLCDRSVEPRNRFVEVAQLHHLRRQRLAHYKRNCFVAALDQLSQFACVSRPLSRDHADLVKWPRKPFSNCVR
jgi:hypothetical protein